VNSVIDMFNIVTPSNDQILKYSSANARFELATDSGGITDVVQDTTPQLGGSLDVNGNSIVSASNGNITITPNGTGSIVLDGLNWPQADGSADQVLKTNGSGQLSFATAGGGGFPIVVFSFQRSDELGGGVERCPVTELVDTGGIASVSSTYNFTLPAGTYLLQHDTRAWSISTGSFIGWNMHNISGDSTKTDFIQRAGSNGSGPMWLNSSYKTITLSSTATFAMQMPSGGSSYSFSGGASPPNPITFTKIA
jgi:hypothetical protein